LKREIHEGQLKWI
jgi:hypothetical protein